MTRGELINKYPSGRSSEIGEESPTLSQVSDIKKNVQFIRPNKIIQDESFISHWTSIYQSKLGWHLFLDGEFHVAQATEVPRIHTSALQTQWNEPSHCSVGVRYNRVDPSTRSLQDTPECQNAKTNRWQEQPGTV